MDSIYIPQLAKMPDQTMQIEVSDYLPDLETLTPVQGKMQVWHRGNYLEVVAEAVAIVTLTCDRCLQQYNHRLKVHPSEMIWLQESPEEAEDYPLEREVSLEELIETLPPNGHFKPAEWLYEQLCLEIPQRKLCDKKCKGIPVTDTSLSGGVDSRWASLETLKRQMLN